MLKGPKSIRNRNWRDSPPRNLRLPQSRDATPEQPAEPEPINPPGWLSHDARLIFEARSAEIQAAGYWQPRYADSLALYSSLMAEYQRNPAQVSAAKVTQMRLLLSELALTPASSRAVAPGPNR